MFPVPYSLAPNPCPLAPSTWHLTPALGFTLLELLIVMALLGVLTAVTYPSIGRGMGTLRLRTASREIAAAIRLARSKALREQQAYYLQFDIDKGEVELSSEDLKYQRSFSLPEGVVFRRVALLGEDSGPYSSDRAYYFAPNGLGENIEVMIANSHGRQMKIIQSSMVSSPKIEESSNKP
jgi:general secretion pathway protein H